MMMTWSRHFVIVLHLRQIFLIHVKRAAGGIYWAFRASR